jgi:hypothetical protein
VRATVVEAERATFEQRLAAAPVADAWSQHRDVLPAWLECVKKAPAAAAGAPVFRGWWRRQSALDFREPA